MKHIAIEEYGLFLGITGERLQISKKGDVIKEVPLHKIKTISISKNGASLSTNLLLDCSMRGIKVFLHDFKNEIVGGIYGMHEHAVSQIRRCQFKATDDPEIPYQISKRLIYGKIRNQRAVLLYFDKYLSKTMPNLSEKIQKAAESIKISADAVKTMSTIPSIDWNFQIMGNEGYSSKVYWAALRDSELLPTSFHGRIGRGANDIANSMLNFGYAVLETVIWNAVTNAGLEPYVGFLHVQRPGKPSLVLDLMEEYRPWVVDRNVIKLSKIEQTKFTPELKKQLIESIYKTISNKYFYKGKKVKLESIIQRQIYRLCAHLYKSKDYQPYLFKW